MSERSELTLVGGQINQVTRNGDTVRRTIGSDRTLAHALLRHLEGKGFAGAPRLLGLDEAGREILTYLPGVVPHSTGDFTDQQLAAAGQLLRRFHDLTADFPPVLAADAEIMCHNDWTPANTVFADDLPYAMIDFDTVAPGTRVWDLAYSVWTWLDLGDGAYSGPEQLRRLAIMLAAYDHPACTLHHVAAYLPGRQAGVANWARERGLQAGAAWAETCLAWTLNHITEVVHPSGRP